jgi:hypothetical protein
VSPTLGIHVQGEQLSAGGPIRTPRRPGRGKSADRVTVKRDDRFRAIGGDLTEGVAAGTVSGRS